VSQLLKDLIDIPTEVHKSDFVISLADGINEPARTVDSYVVTNQLVGCFDSALSLIASAAESRASKGAYLHGSFGSGKSHFMAIVHLLLEGDPHARSKPELGPVVAKYDERLSGRKYLLVPYHMVGAESMEAGVLGGYVEHVRKLHPDAPLPGVYLDESLLADAKNLRERMGDNAFFAGLRGGGEDEGFGELAGGWDAARFDAALREKPGSPERNALVSDYIDAYAGATRDVAGASGRGFVSFANGLDAISRHAKGLGYDAVVLFLDELILWFASRMADPSFVNEEGQKVAKLVEAASANRPAPIVSFIARQRDLRDFLGQGVPGAERLNFGEILQWWEGRFDVIELSDTNLRDIVEKRLLKPRDAAAGAVLDEAFDRVASKAGSALDTLMTSDADRAAFRRVYPFSPALIETLVAVSSYLQRERTALRLLLQLLVDKRDELTVGDLVPLGDLYDVIRGGEEPFSDELKRHFVRARDIYRSKLRPMLLAEYNLQPEELEELPAGHPYRTDDRLVKTLLLAALVPSVDPLRGLTVRRLADLNHGTIKTPIPGHEKAAVLTRLRKWSPDVPELKLEGDAQDPVVSLHLTGIDVQAILDQASHVDNTGARRSKIRELIFDSLEIEDDNSLFAATRTWIWRGSRRKADIRFGNIRDDTDIPSSEFRAQGRPRVMIDFPFDEADHRPADDFVRMQELREEMDPTPTIAWLPLFLTEASLERLGRLVVLDHILAGDRLDGYTSHLSPQDRLQAGHLLRNQADSHRAQMHDVLRQAYGIDRPEEQWVRTDLPLRDQFPSLDPTLDVRPPTAPNLNDAFEQLLDQVMAHMYPAHPRFDDEVRVGDLRTCLKHVERAMEARDHRVDIPQPDRKAVRKVMGPLKVATVGESHIVLDRHWKDHFHRMQQQNPGVTTTVERLKGRIDEPTPMGLDDRVANFVIAAYALMDNRVMVLAGQTIEPDVQRLEPNIELRTQKLPPPEQWTAARPNAQAIFGVDASPILNAANVSRLIDAVKEVANTHADAAGKLVTELDKAAPLVGADSQADRLRTARAARDLIDRIRHAEDVDAVAVLGEVHPPTSAAALGRSIKTAHQVVGAVQRARWEVFGAVAKLQDKRAEQGTSIRDTVRDALQHDELSQGLASVLDSEDRKATQLLLKPTEVPEKPPVRTSPIPGGSAPTDDFPRQGHKERLSREDAAEVLEQLLEHRDELEELTVKWRLRN
jgi:hypothetical protein